MRSGSLRRRSLSLGLSTALSLLLWAAAARAATITVNTASDVTMDDGQCTFREALTAANMNMASGAAGGECGAGSAGLDTIQFAIPGAGVHRITPGGLPTITESVFIDGFTQAGSSANTNPMNAGINAVILIEIYGSSSGGLHLNASNSTIRGLSIHGGGDGITINGSNVTITGNYIGVNPAGTAGESLPSVGVFMLSGNNNFVGGPTAADRNLIAGYRSGSVEINACNGTLVQGNYIGTNAAGTLGLQDLTATPFGVQADPLSTNTTIVGNLISGNATGVAGYGNSIVQGNLIGTQKDGVTALPNVTYGIFLSGNGHLIGGATPSLSNTIAFSGFGVYVQPGVTGNRLQGNSIHSSTHLGIALNGFSFNPFPNDPCDGDTQPGNLGQNYPVLTSATIAGGAVTISGTLNSVAGTAYRIEFFSSPACNTSGNGEGKTYLGFVNATTNGTCDATFGPVGFPVPVGEAVITATATDPNGNTSEFSACVAGGAGGASFYTVTPCRVADTRNPAGPYGGPALAANVDRTFVIAGQCGVPLGAKAAAFNLAVTQPTAGGDLRVFPAGAGLPLVSALNWNPGQTRANNAVIQLGPSGDVTVHPDQPSGTVHLIVDVTGYFQ